LRVRGGGKTTILTEIEQKKGAIYNVTTTWEREGKGKVILANKIGQKGKLFPVREVSVEA